ncbi:VanR-ABDEGLN family response regulator transcription factor [Dorea formicigenerans]|jgi:regulatory protein vanR|uniref:Stage 0 sporulation protein A homolog n=1 Tax=Dorea formicigenerans TaxID=39486 RepID=A0A3E4M177_9FIRM|nr:VanR-ABDEGLN family response regulator transcription factor [Dorea formicigenerans]RGK43062.1 VanR-ABDEGLN family DNA-binding response regulator [Dorea formicigenerans]
MGYKILIVDDEREIADLIEMYLQNENYAVYKSYTAQGALDYVKTEEFDLAILDVMLPGVDGFQICKKIREKYTYPIIMLTARDGEVDTITGLTLGADDYVTKPFKPLALMARVKAQLRRYKKYSGLSELADSEPRKTIITTNNGLVLNISAHTCILNDVPLSLTPTEFKILQTLCEKKGMVVTSEELFKSVWSDEYYDKNSNTITVHVRHLREKMGDAIDEPRYIKTIWGVGYKIEN